MNTRRIERDIRILKWYSAGMTLIVAVFACTAFIQQGGREVGDIRGGRAKFDILDVERINVIEPDGNYRIVLSNRPRSSGPIYMGKPFGYEGGTRPGMLWFNDEGTENGGFTFTGTKCETGTNRVTGRACRVGSYSASTHFTFDQFDQDQILVLNYNDANGTRRVGMTISDRQDANIFDLVQKRDSILRNTPDTAAARAAVSRALGGTPESPAVAERLYLGRDASKSAILNMRDRLGRTRLRLVVDSLGGARIDFLDQNGAVTNSITGAR